MKIYIESEMNNNSVEIFRSIAMRVFNSLNLSGRVLNKREAKSLESEFERNHVTNPDNLFNADDVRQKLYNLSNPYAELKFKGLILKIVQGLIRNKQKTWLLYADDILIGEFHSTNDIKKLVKKLYDENIYI